MPGLADTLIAEALRQPSREASSGAVVPILRNGICPCGSGKKYKHCCGAHDSEEEVARTIRRIKQIEENPQTPRELAEANALKAFRRLQPLIARFFALQADGEWQELANDHSYREFMEFMCRMEEWHVVGEKEAPFLSVAKSWWIAPENRKQPQGETMRFVRDICLPIERYRKTDLGVADQMDPVAEARNLDASWRTFGKRWEENIVANNEAGRFKDFGTKPPLPAPENGVVYVVGSGPSLMSNGKELFNVRKGSIVGVNEVTQFPGLAALLDYYMVLDAGAPWIGSDERIRSWMHGNDDDGKPIDLSKTVGLLGPFTQPGLDPAAFKSAHYFNITSRFSLTNRLRHDFPDLLELDAGGTVTFSALAFAALAKPKVVVLVGQDFCDLPKPGAPPAASPGSQEYMGHFNADDGSHLGFLRRGLTNRYCKTTLNLMFCCGLVMGVLYWLTQHNIRIINATERGMLYRSWDGGRIEQMKLADVIQEFET